MLRTLALTQMKRLEWYRPVHSMPCSQHVHAPWPRKVEEQQLAQWTPDQERGDVVVGAVVADTAM